MRKTKLFNNGFRVYYNNGGQKKKILNKLINTEVPFPRVRREILEKFTNVEPGQIRAIWSDQASYLGTRELKDSVGYACRLTWENVSLGLVGHFESWVQADETNILSGLENWVENLIRYKGFDPQDIKRATTWLIIGTSLYNAYEHGRDFINGLERSLTEWNPSWNPSITHTRLICSQPASGFVLNIHEESDNDCLSFIWPVDETLIKIDRNLGESFLLTWKKENWILKILKKGLNHTLLKLFIKKR